MKLINRIVCFTLVCLGAWSCSDADDEQSDTLLSYLNTMSFENGGVIACAASDQNTNAILTFYYPEPGATDIRFYETNTTDVDPNDFSNYQQILIESEPFFNGYLGRFTQLDAHGKWIVITFELQGDIKVSNPIRSKQITKPTVWNDAVIIDQSQPGMPEFTWTDNAYGDNAIYFQVVSNSNNDLVSGTYTYDNTFQFYNTDNVVLNVTRQAPSSLVGGQEYNFTLMDVSEDNWVNWVILKTFEVL